MKHQQVKSKDKRLGGFTLIELMLATVIFSLVMIVILASALQIGRIYYKGVSIANTDESARAVISDISNDVQLSNTSSTGTFGSGYFCIGLHRYSFKLYHKVTNDDIQNQAVTGILQDVVKTGCPSPADGLGTDVKQLLGPDMQLNSLVFSCANGGCTVGVHIVFYGADNTVFSSSEHPQDSPAAHLAALDDTDATCSGNLLSTQFCATADLQTKVLQRS